MHPYVNIHTHHLSADSGVFVFNNRLGFDKTIYTQSYFSVGIHPWDVNRVSDEYYNELEKYLQYPNCLAVGECGLDKFTTGIPLQQQIHHFQQQLQLAMKYQKPVIIHCVKAFDELIKIAQPFTQNVKLIIHGFHKSHEMAEQLISKGFYLSLNPSLFKQEGFDSGKLPLDKLFLETDDKDDLSIQMVYEMAGTKLSLDQEELKTKIYHNFAAVFL